MALGRRSRSSALGGYDLYRLANPHVAPSARTYAGSLAWMGLHRMVHHAAVSAAELFPVTVAAAVAGEGRAYSRSDRHLRAGTPAQSHPDSHHPGVGSYLLRSVSALPQHLHSPTRSRHHGAVRRRDRA